MCVTRCVQSWLCVSSLARVMWVQGDSWEQLQQLQAVAQASGATRTAACQGGWLTPTAIQ